MGSVPRFPGRKRGAPQQIVAGDARATISWRARPPDFAFAAAVCRHFDLQTLNFELSFLAPLLR